MSFGSLTRAILVVAVVAGLASAPAFARAEGLSQALPPQPLADALETFARSVGLQLVYGPEITKGLRSPGAEAGHSVEDTLRELLRGTGLTFEFVNAKTVTLRTLAPAKANSPAANAPAQGLKLAGLQSASADSREGGAGAQSERDGEDADAKGTPEILVKGQRTLNSDIKRTEDDPQPYMVFDSEELRRSQAENLGEFLNMRLPMNTGTIFNATGTADTHSSINLRGLGANQTLILVDGRRMPGSQSNGFPTQADINGISMASIERVEVLASTAGGIYGGSATGGVINIILRRDYQAVDFNATYANTFDTDVSGIRLDASAGFNLQAGRTHVMLSGSHSEANNLVVADRDFIQRGLALTLDHNPAAINGLSTPPIGGTVNIRSTGNALTLDSRYGGTVLPFNFTHIPYGYAGPGSDSGAALVRNAGSYNLDVPAGLSGLGRGMRAAPSLDSFTANVRHEFGLFEAFLDVSSFGDKGDSPAGTTPRSVRVLRGNAPNNPFVQDIRVTFPSPGLGFHARSESVTARATAGLIARLGHGWTAEADYGWSRSRYRYFGVSSFIDAAGTASLNSGLAPGDGRPALDALQEQNTFPLDFGPYLLPTPSAILGPFDTVGKDITLHVSGPAMSLPGGAVTLSALIERRGEELQDGIQQVTSPTTGTPTYSLYPHRSQNADSLYLEATAPLISARNAWRLIREFELQASVRHDRYRTASTPDVGTLASRDSPVPAFSYTTTELGSTDYTLGFRLAPIRDVALRASFGTGFLPPSVTQVAPQSQIYDFDIGVMDHRRGDTDTGTGVPFTYLYGGSADLKPERSRSWSAGIILTPRFLPDLRLSVDYTHIGKRDEIQTPDPQFLLDNEASYPGRIERGPNLGTDEPGWAGPITRFDTTLINLAQTEVEAYDIQLDYVWKMQERGELHLYSVATWAPHFKNRLLPQSPLTDKTGFVDGPLKWRGNMGLDWTRGPLTLGWNAQYYNSYFIGYADPSSAVLNPGLIADQGSGGIIPSQMYHDLIATYRFDQTGAAGAAGFLGRMLSGSQLSLGIQNVFNTAPPTVAATTVFDPGYSTYADPRLRRYSVTLRKSFQ